MENSKDPPVWDEISWRSPDHVQAMGSIHTNTGNPLPITLCTPSLTCSPLSVLPYFYESPFFDKTSNNATLTTQGMYNQNLFYILGTRKLFEERLRSMQGLEFMVTHDPSEGDTKFDHSGVWVIRKQHRRKRQGMQDEVTGIASYYVVGDTIYMSSSVANIISSKLVRVRPSAVKPH